MRTTLGIVLALACVGVPAHGIAASTRETGVDVSLAEPQLPRRYVVLEWDAAQMALDKYRGNLILMPIEHHALYLSGFSAFVVTEPVAIEFDPQDNGTVFAERQEFKGYGGEIGYRYYAGLAGPQGLFLGPAFVLGKYTQTSGNGVKNHFTNSGVAFDVGYAALIAQRVAVSLAGGLQWTSTSVSLPNQLFPADWLVNEGFRPRFQLSIGVAL